MRIDSGGTVAVGTTDTHTWDTFDGRIRVGARGCVATTTGSTQVGHNWYYNSGYKYIGSDYASRVVQAGGYVSIETAASGSADGAITFSEKARFQNTGGISFNGDTAAANALDDYEEGTFTPTLKKGAHTNFTYANQIGKYTKIGNVYKISFYVFCNNTATTSNGATWELTGLPFNISSLANCAYQFVACGYLIIGNTNYGNNVHRWQANSSTSLSLYGQNSTQEHTGSNLELSGTGIITVA
jgi:hypothetical protein